MGASPGAPRPTPQGSPPPKPSKARCSPTDTRPPPPTHLCQRQHCSLSTTAHTALERYSLSIACTNKKSPRNRHQKFTSITIHLPPRKGRGPRPRPHPQNEPAAQATQIWEQKQFSQRQPTRENTFIAKWKVSLSKPVRECFANPKLTLQCGRSLNGSGTVCRSPGLAGELPSHLRELPKPVLLHRTRQRFPVGTKGQRLSRLTGRSISPIADLWGTAPWVPQLHPNKSVLLKHPFTLTMFQEAHTCQALF